MNEHLNVNPIMMCNRCGGGIRFAYVGCKACGALICDKCRVRYAGEKEAPQCARCLHGGSPKIKWPSLEESGFEKDEDTLKIYAVDKGDEQC